MLVSLLIVDVNNDVTVDHVDCALIRLKILKFYELKIIKSIFKYIKIIKKL